MQLAYFITNSQSKYRNLESRLAEKINELKYEVEMRRQVEASLLESCDSMQLKAETDAGTGVLNRGAILNQLATTVEKSRITNEPYSVVFIDIDHFKVINDTYGHLAGDEILRGVAKLLGHTLRQADRLGRFGGEEFIVILNRCDVNDAYLVGERLRAIVARHTFDIQDAPIPVTISLGVVAPESLQDASLYELLEKADQAMYRAKQEGRNRVETIHVPSQFTATSNDPFSITVPNLSLSH